MSKACPWGIPHHDGIDCVYCERAALRAENERLRRWRCEADCRYTMGDVAETSGSHCPTDRPCARCEAEMENERLWALLREVAQGGVESADERVRYVTVQIDRDTWAAVQEEARRV